MIKKYSSRFLEGKRVLFIGYEYYTYAAQIRKALEEAGAAVQYHSVMKYGLRYSLIRNLSKKRFLEYCRGYGERILRAVHGYTFDYVFVIQGFQLLSEFYARLREMNSHAIFLNYHWDSVRETVYGNTLLDLLPYFDRVYSFDRRDCDENRVLLYLPLFYAKEYERLRGESQSTNPDIDLLFIGTLSHYRRYQYVKQIERICSDNGIRFFYYLYISRRAYVRTLMRGNFLGDVRLAPLTVEEIIDLYRRANVILDLPNHFQSGLTMRAMEALGAGKKLITTNMAIKKEPFYDTKNVFVIDPADFSFDFEFISRPPTFWNNALEEYAISAWVHRIFCDGTF